MDSFSYFAIALFVVLGILSGFIIARELRAFPKGTRSGLGIFFLILGCTQIIISVVLSAGTLINNESLIPLFSSTSIFQAALYILIAGTIPGLFAIGIGKLLLYLKLIFIKLK